MRYTHALHEQRTKSSAVIGERAQLVDIHFVLNFAKNRTLGMDGGAVVARYNGWYNSGAIVQLMMERWHAVVGVL